MPAEIVQTSAGKTVRCPGCNGWKRFYHCGERCRVNPHVVTCRDCKVDYLTSEHLPDYVRRTGDWS